MADIKWIKITTDIFDDEKMKIIDTMPARDEIIVIWFKLLSLAGKINQNGLLYLSKKIAYTPETLSAVFNRTLNTVTLALSTFENFGMIDIEDNNIIGISNWEKHQNIEGMDKIREQNRIRQQNHREKKDLKLLSNVTSRDSNAIDKIRIEEDKEENKNKYNPSDDLVYFLDDDFKYAWKELIKSRSKLKCSNSDLAIKKLIGIINKESKNKEHAILMIEESIIRGWKSLFPVEYKNEEAPTTFRTQEEKRYYLALDMKKKDPLTVKDEWVEEKRKAMEKSLCTM